MKNGSADSFRWLRDWGNFVKDEGIGDKVNQAMTADNMDRFLEQRLEDLSNATKESYIRGWSSLVQGLNEKNISTHVQRDIGRKTKRRRTKLLWCTKRGLQRAQSSSWRDDKVLYFKNLVSWLQRFKPARILTNLVHKCVTHSVFTLLKNLFRGCKNIVILPLKSP